MPQISRLRFFPIVFFGFVSFFSITSLLPAQSVSSSSGLAFHALEPSLVVAGKEGPPKPLKLVGSDFLVRIVGFLVEVTATYDFYNPSDKNEEVEGVFTFPLPPGATVDGYALDIDGVIVDGVAVPKQRATVVFNEIESRGIDPGLVEWSGQEMFKSRVYPIFPKKSRHIQIRYTTLIDEQTCTIPIRSDGKINICTIRLEAEQLAEAPKIVPSVSEKLTNRLNFRKNGEHFLAEATIYDFEPKENLVLEFPQQAEQAQSIAGKSDEGTVYYVQRQPLAAIRERLEPKRLEKETALQNPKRIAVYWDASASRWNADHAKEIELLRQYLNAKRPKVDLYILGFGAWGLGTGNATRFEPNDYEKLFDTLKNIPYDGAADPTALLSNESDAELALLFSSGWRPETGGGRFFVDDSTSSVDTIFINGAVAPLQPPASGLPPFYLICSGSAESVCPQPVEAVFDLQRDSIESIVQGIGRVSLKASVKTVVKPDTQEKEPPCVALKNMLYLAGKANEKTNESVEIRFTIANEEIETFRIQPKISNISDDENMPLRLWSQMRLDALLGEPNRNRKAILEHGLKYRLVTPETSLLVLESKEQYLEFEVEPPKSQPELFEEYHKSRLKYEKYLKHARKNQISHGVKMLQHHWKMFQRWYEHDFKVPENYQYVPKYYSLEEAFDRPSDRPVRRIGYGWGYGGNAGSFGGGMGGYGGGASVSSSGAGYYGDDDDSTKTASGQIVLQPRDADSPYLGKIRDAAKESTEKAYSMYLQQRNQYRRSPVFYWESAILFEELGERKLALRILSNIQELGFEDDATTQRMIGFLMLQWNCFEEAKARFRQALELSKYDFASFRGLALAFTLQKNRPETEKEKEELRTVFRNMLNECWSRFDTGSSNIDYKSLLIMLVEFARCELEIGKEATNKAKAAKPFELDLRIVATTSHAVNVKLAIDEPSGEKIRRGNTLSVYGGTISENNAADEMPSVSQYMIRKVDKGKYKITLERYDLPIDEYEDWDWEEVFEFEDWIDYGEGEWDNYEEEKEGFFVGEKDKKNKDEDEDEKGEPNGVKKEAVFAPGVVFVDIFTNYGRANEKRRSLCVTLNDETDIYHVCDVEFP